MTINNFTQYNAIILILPIISTPFGDIADCIAQHFHERRDVFVLTSPQQMKVQCAEWALSITWKDGPVADAEIRYMVEHYAADRPDAAQIAACNRCVEIVGDNDPQLNYLCEFMDVLEIFESLDGVFFFDPHQQKFL